MNTNYATSISAAEEERKTLNQTSVVDVPVVSLHFWKTSDLRNKSSRLDGRGGAGPSLHTPAAANQNKIHRKDGEHDTLQYRILFPGLDWLPAFLADIHSCKYPQC